MINSLLVANRGEIARRVFRTCADLGISTVAVFSDADATLPFVREADEAVRIGPAPPRESYLAIDRVLAAGYRVVLEPGAVVDHLVGPERCRSSYYWRRLWWQGVTRARTDASVGVTARLLAALPIRLCLYAGSRDRVHLYRAAETLGYLRELAA
jgi:hypothetical protein